MAHKLEYEEPKKKWKLPPGKFGVCFVFGTRELFIGITLQEVEMERVIRKIPSKTPVFKYDPTEYL